jgi:hypothetical protein
MRITARLLQRRPHQEEPMQHSKNIEPRRTRHPVRRWGGRHRERWLDLIDGEPSGRRTRGTDAAQPVEPTDDE